MLVPPSGDKPIPEYDAAILSLATAYSNIACQRCQSLHRHKHRLLPQRKLLRLSHFHDKWVQNSRQISNQFGRIVFLD